MEDGKAGNSSLFETSLPYSLLNQPETNLYIETWGGRGALKQT